MVGDEGVAVKSGDNQVFLFDALDGGRKWAYQRATPPLSVRSAGSPVFADRYLFVDYPGGKLVALALQNGAPVWEGAVASPKGATELDRVADVVATPVVDGRQVCAVAFQGRVACFDMGQGGAMVWSRDISSVSGLVMDGRYLFITDGQGVTRPGPLYPLLALPLAGVNEDTLKSWYDSEALAGKHQAARALMMFRGFLRWCSGREEYRSLTDREAGRSAAILENLPAIPAAPMCWNLPRCGGGGLVEQLPNRTASVYLRALLLTGARREELAALTWDSVDFQWRKLTLADKVETTRTIPLTPYLAQLLATLPRVNQFVFASSGKTGRIVDVRASHERVLRAVGIQHLTFHGFRRANKQRGRSVAPHGAVDQIQGHKPSGTADGYAILPIDDLRPFAELIETHILTLAGVQFDAKAAPAALRVVAG